MISHKSPAIGMDSLIDPDFDTWSQFIPSSTQDADDTLDISPQQQLWVAVVRQTVEDALMKPEETFNPEASRMHQSQARAILFSKSSVTASYFNEVCNLAGVPARTIREMVAKLIKETENAE